MNIDDQPIFLVGFMASGKSTVGKALAKALGWRLLDTDDLVEEREQRSVERIFSESGQPFFRQAEADVLRSLDDLRRAVVATGGGLFLGYESRRWLIDHGRTVWLDVPLEAARRRVEGGRSGRRGRPLWEGNDALALRALYEKALSHPQVVGLAVGTRSDCVPDDVLDLLEELAGRTYLSVEYGMQTMHNRSLDWMNRGHHHDSFLEAVERSRGRGFEICAHAILGLPGESHDDMLATARELARVNVDAVKLHNLYCVKNTALADQFAAGEVDLMGRDDYVRTVVDFLELLPPTMVVERISGDAPPDYFVGPSWCLDKPAVKTAIEAEFERRDTWQGKAVGEET